MEQNIDLVCTVRRTEISRAFAELLLGYRLNTTEKANKNVVVQDLGEIGCIDITTEHEVNTIL